jgi:hypothetical protein
MLLVIFSRLRRGKPIYMASTDHLYHRLTDLGLHPNRSVSLMQVSAILLSLIAFLALGANVLVANLVFGSVVLLGLLILAFLEWKYADS